MHRPPIGFHHPYIRECFFIFREYCVSNIILVVFWMIWISILSKIFHNIRVKSRSMSWFCRLTLNLNTWQSKNTSFIYKYDAKSFTHINQFRHLHFFFQFFDQKIRHQRNSSAYVWRRKSSTHSVVNDVSSFHLLWMNDFYFVSLLIAVLYQIAGILCLYIRIIKVIAEKWNIGERYHWCVIYTVKKVRYESKNGYERA